MAYPRILISLTLIFIPRVPSHSRAESPHSRPRDPDTERLALTLPSVITDVDAHLQQPPAFTRNLPFHRHTSEIVSLWQHLSLSLSLETFSRGCDISPSRCPLREGANPPPSRDHNRRSAPWASRGGRSSCFLYARFYLEERKKSSSRPLVEFFLELLWWDG